MESASLAKTETTSFHLRAKSQRQVVITPEKGRRASRICSSTLQEELSFARLSLVCNVRLGCLHLSLLWFRRGLTACFQAAQMGAAAGGMLLLSSPTHSVLLPSLRASSLGTSWSAAAQGGDAIQNVAGLCVQPSELVCFGRGGSSVCTCWWVGRQAWHVEKLPGSLKVCWRVQRTKEMR